MEDVLKTARMGIVIHNTKWDKTLEKYMWEEELEKTPLKQEEKEELKIELNQYFEKSVSKDEKAEKAKRLAKQAFEQLKNQNPAQVLEEKKEDLLVEYAEIMGIVCVVKDLKTSQIRKFLDAVHKLDMQRQRGEGFEREKVFLLKPKIAYAAGKKEEVRPLMDVLSPCIDKVWTTPDNAKSEEAFKKLVSFVEAIVAYHKFYGGQD